MTTEFASTTIQIIAGTISLWEFWIGLFLVAFVSTVAFKLIKIPKRIFRK